MKTVFTVAVVQAGERILLGYKKTKIGKGYWNGFGGKVEDGETVAEAAARELEEESGLVAGRIDERGQITASFRDSDDIFELRIFLVTETGGSLRETREMKPRWFAVNELPYDKMWASDKAWWPMLLANKHFAGRVRFDNLDNRQMLSCEVKEKELAYG